MYGQSCLDLYLGLRDLPLECTGYYLILRFFWLVNANSKFIFDKNNF